MVVKGYALRAKCSAFQVHDFYFYFSWIRNTMSFWIAVGLPLPNAVGEPSKFLLNHRTYKSVLESNMLIFDDFKAWFWSRGHSKTQKTFKSNHKLVKYVRTFGLWQQKWFLSFQNLHKYVFQFVFYPFPSRNYALRRVWNNNHHTQLYLVAYLTI